MKKRVAKKKTHVAKKKVAKKAIASEIHPSRAEARAQSDELRGLYSKKLEELPEEKQKFAKAPYFPLPWNGMTAEQRERSVMNLRLKDDNEAVTQEDKEDECDFIKSFEIHEELITIEQKITIRENMILKSMSPTEMAENEKQLKELREKKNKLEKCLAEIESLQSTTAITGKRPAVDRKDEMQADIDKLANKIIQDKRTPSLGSMAYELSKMQKYQGISATTIERLTRVTWKKKNSNRLK